MTAHRIPMYQHVIPSQWENTAWYGDRREPTCTANDHGAFILPCTCPMDAEDTSDEPTVVVNLAPTYYEDEFLNTVFPLRWTAEMYVRDSRRQRV